ncbi:hypothetical protein CAPTEDRAFT_101871 [Capitella teleta]|uniref:Putative ATP-dependent RNA helicase DHX57 n=1 Tax=Capitella teleta TaxID=283909 RepID=R7T6Q4_CAPTE|nr:hypothetical protein CAPTEDRAFT_101871 [Capitella teleta]|eukprot:ELT89229.1 hypothetical protein CAPTEDRAFT_101871 [Capitella teleta]
MQAARHRLPAAKWDLEIVQMLKHGQVLVISGMTGCGKTTQVPQFILDASLKSKTGQVANILCTQPRRISAMSVAERVADERAEKLGGIVGYQIRLESVMSTRTRLLFCTTGILLRRLESDPTLQGVTHILIDEVHERSEDSDFLMMVVRNLLPQRYDLKVILMSATLDAGLFSAYFNDCPRLEIPGRTFPVEQYFLEDVIEMTGYHLDERSPFARPLKRMNAAPKAGVSTRLPTDDIIDEIEQATNAVAPRHSLQDQNLTPKQLVARYPGIYNKLTLKTLAMIDFDKINNELIELLLEWIVDGPHQYPREGAVLVFLPGLAEIKQVYELLLTNPVFGGRNKSRFWILPLHSTLSSEDQHRVFSTPPKGTTKIVLTTNIAETSITIDDVVYVIDSGRMKEKRYDASKSMESLDLVWESKANAQQRKGRAGRVASGVAFHLFTSHRHDYHMKPQPIPEIQRVPLEQLILRIKILDLFDNMQDVLSQLIEPPADIGIETAKSRLQDLGALDLDKNLTPLGYHLASLPVDVRIGKLMLFGAIFRCLDSALTIAATLSYRSPFVSPFDKRNEADKCKLDFAIGNSDHLTMLNAYKSWIKAQKDGSQAAFRFCQENFLSIKTMQMLATMKHQFTELLSDIGFIREGILCRDLERKFRGSDGVLAVTGQEANVHNDNMKLLSAILVAALFPNVVQIKTPEAKYSKTGEGAVARLPKPEELRFSTKSDGYVSIHPSSVNFQVRYYDSPYLVYHEKIKTTKVYIRDCSMVSVYPLLLFGGCIIAIDLDRNDFIMSVDEGWIRFKAANQEVAELVRELRLELNQLLRDKIEAPSMDLCACPRGSQIIETIVRLISTQ